MKKNNFIVFLLLLLFGFLSVLSMWNDSAIVDEGPHLPAGYSYLTQKDMRLNPEHPPLLKDLAAIPLLFMNINFPSQIKSGTDDINGQWDFGHYFLYNSGNDAQNMMRAGRLPIILISLLLGFFVFKFASELWGKNIGFLALFVVGMVYVWHVWNYPPERQLNGTIFTLGSFGFQPAVDFVVWLVKSNFIFSRALGQYF